jgi:hypothetical protein
MLNAVKKSSKLTKNVKKKELGPKGNFFLYQNFLANPITAMNI